MMNEYSERTSVSSASFLSLLSSICCVVRCCVMWCTGTECLVTSKFGEETWHKIKEKANCEVVDGGFLRYKYYPDSDTVTLVIAASEVLGISVDGVLEAFGDYFIDYVQENGYSNVLECLGKNLRDWLSNLNTLHDHLQASYPKGFVAPVFWSEDDPASSAEEGAILVYYYSQRGSLLVPLVVGILKKLARVYFDIEINLERLTLQDEAIGGGTEGETHKHTSWRVTAKNPEEAYKLRGKKRRSREGSGKDDDGTVTTSGTGVTTVKNYHRAFREGGTQAAFLRVEELVQRAFFKKDCALFHAMTLEQYIYLVDFWKRNKLENPDPSANPRIDINDDSEGTDLYCFEIWTLQEGDPTSWPRLEHLPPKLNPATIDPAHFGGKIPATGAYPPDEQGVLQSFLPKIRVVNSVNKEKSVDLSLDSRALSSTLEETMSNNPHLMEAKVTSFDDEDPEIAERLKRGDLEVKWVIWDETTDRAYHTFTQNDLSRTTVQQLYDLVAGANLDPVTISLRLSETVAVGDDEEDI